MMSNVAIQIEDLTHAYPGRPRRATRGHANRRTEAGTGLHLRDRALDGVSFSVQRGEIFGILGPNGGGKTTLFRILSTLLRPTGGRVRVLGRDVQTHPHEVRRQLGVVFQMPSLDLKLSGRENLIHQGHLYGLRAAALDDRISDRLEQLGLGARADQFVEVLSGGLRRRVELAKALLHDPPLLLLDEPSSGLDVAVRRELWGYLKRLRNERGTTIAVTTHLMDEAEQCDRLAILHQGKLVALDTAANLTARIGGDVITIEPMANGADSLAQAIAERFEPWEHGGRPAVVEGRVFLEKPNGPSFVATLAGAYPGRIKSITVGQPTLEDVFIQLTGCKL